MKVFEFWIVWIVVLFPNQNQSMKCFWFFYFNHFGSFSIFLVKICDYKAISMFWTFKTVITDLTIFKILLFRLNFDRVLIKKLCKLVSKTLPYICNLNFKNLFAFTCDRGYLPKVDVHLWSITKSERVGSRGTWTEMNTT